MQDVLYGKITASLILVQPISILYTGLVAYAARDLLIPLLSYYSFNSYWVMGSTINLAIILKLLWSSNTAWTELSLGIIKRLFVTIISIIPLIVLTPFIFIAYILDIRSAITVTLLIPLPILLHVLYEIPRDRVI